MARIRSVKPEFWTDEDLCRDLTRDQRLFYIGLWCEADDEGRFHASPRKLLGAIFPWDEDITEASVSHSLSVLCSTHRVLLYRVDGRSYGQIVSWHRHQKPNRPTPSRLPPPPSNGADSDALSERLSEASVSDSAGTHCPELGIRSRELGVRNRELGAGSTEPILNEPASCPPVDQPEILAAMPARFGDSGQVVLPAHPALTASESLRSRTAADLLAQGKPVVDLWRLVCLPAGFPDAVTTSWKRPTMEDVARAALDLPATKALFERVAASTWMRQRGGFDLGWVLGQGREAIENGRYSGPATPAPTAPSSRRHPLYGIDCSALDWEQYRDLRRDSMVAGNNTTAGAEIVRRRLQELANV